MLIIMYVRRKLDNVCITVCIKSRT